MCELGHAAVEFVVDRLARIDDLPVARRSSRPELEALLREPVPCGPREPLEVLDRVVHTILPACAATDHPRFFSYVPGPSNYVSAVADFLASGANVFAGHWLVGAGAAQVEIVVVDWLRQVFGLPEAAGGTLTSGGTAATLVAVHAARVDRLGQMPGHGARLYVSDQTHAAIIRGLGFQGFARSQLRRIAARPDMTMDPRALEASIAADRDSGATPMCVIATAGTTSTGAVDPLAAIADVCEQHRVWLHVDAAYGGAAVLTERGRRLLRGLERADSIAVDPHKWWFQPYEVGCVLVRDAEVLRRAYTLHAEYLTETRSTADPVNFYDYGPQLTRSFRALKLWMSLQVFGLDAIRSAVEHGLTMAEQAELLLRDRPHWRIVTPAQLGIVTFEPHLPHHAPDRVRGITRAIAEDTIHDGHALVLTTDLGTGPVLRMCTTHPETTTSDLTSTVDLLDRLLAHHVDKP